MNSWYLATEMVVEMLCLVYSFSLITIFPLCIHLDQNSTKIQLATVVEHAKHHFLIVINDRSAVGCELVWVSVLIYTVFQKKVHT